MFDEAFAAADEAMFAAHDNEKARFWRASNPVDVIEVEAVDMPRDEANSYQAGGRVDETDLSLECKAGPLAPQAADFGAGWRCIWRDRNFRVLGASWQGSTVTVRCGALAE
jgi:hypothetical protein